MLNYFAPGLRYFNYLNLIRIFVFVLSVDPFKGLHLFYVHAEVGLLNTSVGLPASVEIWLTLFGSVSQKLQSGKLTLRVVFVESNTRFLVLCVLVWGVREQHDFVIILIGASWTIVAGGLMRPMRIHNEWRKLLLHSR